MPERTKRVELRELNRIQRTIGDLTRVKFAAINLLQVMEAEKISSQSPKFREAVATLQENIGKS